MKAKIDKLKQIIAEQLTMMLGRRVDYAPSNADDFKIAVRMMQSDLIKLNLTDDDCVRVERAFETIALHIGRWPTAVMVKDNMPKRERPPLIARDKAAPAVGRKYAEQSRTSVRKGAQNRRSKMLPGENLHEYMRLTEDLSNDDEAAFGAHRMVRNGWTADEEEIALRLLASVGLGAETRSHDFAVLNHMRRLEAAGDNK